MPAASSERHLLLALDYRVITMPRSVSRPQGVGVMLCDAANPHPPTHPTYPSITSPSLHFTSHNKPPQPKHPRTARHPLPISTNPVSPQPNPRPSTHLPRPN